MTASEIATLLVPALHQQGFRAVRHPHPTPNGYGHKITLFESQGPALGALVIYAGKHGPRYTTNELSALTPALETRLAQAWANREGGRADATVPTLPSAPTPQTPAPQSVELWVDGACLQEPEGLRFGWAYVIRHNGHEIARHASSEIAPHTACLRNVSAEIHAVLAGLTHCQTIGATNVTVYHDYEGLAAWPTKRWKTTTIYTQTYVQAIRDFPITIIWHKIAAHTGIPMNELVDTLATTAARHSRTRYP